MLKKSYILHVRLKECIFFGWLPLGMIISRFFFYLEEGHASPINVVFGQYLGYFLGYAALNPNLIVDYYFISTTSTQTDTLFSYVF